MSEARLVHICRHPIKSVGYQELERVALQAGGLLPFDRAWAVAHDKAQFDGQPEGWKPKMNFLRGFSEAALMAIRAEFDDATQEITLTAPARPAIRLRLPEEAEALLDWLRPIWPERLGAPKALVARQDGGAMTDIREPHVALLNLASLRDLGEKMGQSLSIHRFRGNLWIDGLAPWSELEMVGQEITIGDIRLKIEARIKRCKATCANPETGAFDGDTLATLRQHFDHQDFGVYASILNDGELSIGAPVQL